jgi:hypothetical protein
MELNLYSSIGIVLGFSLLVVFLDEVVVRRWREKRWEREAASGDKQAQELLKMARSAKVSDE